jgi:hypothetical protein
MSKDGVRSFLKTHVPSNYVLIFDRKIAVNVGLGIAVEIKLLRIPYHKSKGMFADCGKRLYLLQTNTYTAERT